MFDIVLSCSIKNLFKLSTLILASPNDFGNTNATNIAQFDRRAGRGS
jgi:hypothetical protein